MGVVEEVRCWRCRRRSFYEGAEVIRVPYCDSTRIRKGS
jgi:hypothetical protein